MIPKRQTDPLGPPTSADPARRDCKAANWPLAACTFGGIAPDAPPPQGPANINSTQAANARSLWSKDPAEQDKDDAHQDDDGDHPLAVISPLEQPLHPPLCAHHLAVCAIDPTLNVVEQVVLHVKLVADLQAHVVDQAERAADRVEVRVLIAHHCVLRRHELMRVLRASRDKWPDRALHLPSPAVPA
eukprot:CAMPEP_0179945264 /NCGR_PEP_ID=MMETSP0983-20121128/19576_1 /TAXON_ID=483367 /ORGANISM="non described non described, Strain CCMP 2436" /LENGTH=186 /DNA_ID=CAMNT_0021853659 /DNA_START=134 /DNA_END=691 /DNA_ORIENTATION=+